MHWTQSCRLTFINYQNIGKNASRKIKSSIINYHSYKNFDNKKFMENLSVKIVAGRREISNLE